VRYAAPRFHRACRRRRNILYFWAACRFGTDVGSTLVPGRRFTGLTVLLAAYLLAAFF
jgi:hypothetical protein